MRRAAKPASLGMPSRHFALSKVGQGQVDSRSPPSCHSSRVLEPDPSQMCGHCFGEQLSPTDPQHSRSHIIGAGVRFFTTHLMGNKSHA